MEAEGKNPYPHIIAYCSIVANHINKSVPIDIAPRSAVGADICTEIATCGKGYRTGLHALAGIVCIIYTRIILRSISLCGCLYRRNTVNTDRTGDSFGLLHGDSIVYGQFFCQIALR